MRLSEEIALVLSDIDLVNGIVSVNKARVEGIDRDQTKTGDVHKALGPWLEHRHRQDHLVSLIAQTDSPEAIRRQIREVAQGGQLRFVVLVGDASPGGPGDIARAACCVPVHLAAAKVNVLWGSEPHIATDGWYADFDDPRLPQAAVGRLPARSPEERLRQIVAKILAYERCARFRAVATAGERGGEMADSDRWPTWPWNRPPAISSRKTSRPNAACR